MYRELFAGAWASTHILTADVQDTKVSQTDELTVLAPRKTGAFEQNTSDRPKRHELEGWVVCCCLTA